jgi:hypothetical protein
MSEQKSGKDLERLTKADVVYLKYVMRRAIKMAGDMDVRAITKASVKEMANILEEALDYRETVLVMTAVEQAEWQGEEAALMLKEALEVKQRIAPKETQVPSPERMRRMAEANCAKSAMRLACEALGHPTKMGLKLIEVARILEEAVKEWKGKEEPPEPEAA